MPGKAIAPHLLPAAHKDVMIRGLHLYSETDRSHLYVPSSQHLKPAEARAPQLQECAGPLQKSEGNESPRE